MIDKKVIEENEPKRNLSGGGRGAVEKGKERACLMIGIIVVLIAWSRKKRSEKWKPPSLSLGIKSEASPTLCKHCH